MSVRELLAVRRLECLDLDPGAAEPRLGLLNGNPVRRRVDPEQELTLADPLIVLDRDFDNLAGNPGIDRVLRYANKSVVCPNIWLVNAVFGGSAKSQRDGEGGQQGAA